MLRVLKSLELGQSVFGVDWSNLWLQPQDGSVNLTPSLHLSDYLTFKSGPPLITNLQDPAELARKISMMERATWEAYALIRARTDVQRALDECCDALGAPALVRVPSLTSFGVHAAKDPPSPDSH